MRVETLTFDDGGAIPHSALPVLVYRGALQPDAGPAAYEDLFAGNGWLGGRVDLSAGDIVVLPAGTGHCNAGSEPGLLVVGAYPNGMRWDLRRGDPAEHDDVLANIALVPLPDTGPVEGREDPLAQLWSSTA